MKNFKFQGPQTETLTLYFLAVWGSCVCWMWPFLICIFHFFSITHHQLSQQHEVDNTRYRYRQKGTNYRQTPICLA
jgi:hypothetical protein